MFFSLCTVLSVNASAHNLCLSLFPFQTHTDPSYFPPFFAFLPSLLVGTQNDEYTAFMNVDTSEKRKGKIVLDVGVNDLLDCYYSCEYCFVVWGRRQYALNGPLISSMWSR